MRAIITVVFVLLLTGCKTTELSVFYPAAGLQIVAKVETRDPPPFEHAPHSRPEQMTALPPVEVAERR